MKSSTTVYLICSPSRRVGTTTVARLLADYFAANAKPFAGFDTDPHEQTFASAFPGEVLTADLNAIQGQIALFDRLLVHDEVPKIIDVWNRAYKPFFTLVREIGFFEEAERQQIRPVILFMADNTQASVEAAQALRTQWPDVEMILVNNEGAAELGADALDILAAYPADQSFRIPALDPIMRKTVEDPSFSFSRFLLAPPTNMSIIVKTGLRTWLARIYQQFKSYELRVALQDTEFLR